MNTPPKKNTQKESPVSKSRLEDSPLFNYLTSLSPLNPVRSILNPQPFSPENIASPSPVFTTPGLDIEWPSRFFKTHNSSSDPTNAVESTSNEEAAPKAEINNDASMGKKASTEMELPQGIKYDCSGTNLDTFVASPLGTRVGKQAMQPDSNNAPESSDAIPYEDVSLFHRGVRRRCLDFEMPGNKQTLNENNTAVSESSSRWFLLGIGVHLNPIVMSSKEKRIKLFPRSGESCKPCNCKMSKCLKLYCECFSAVVYCTETCSCVDCFNKPLHEDTILATRKRIESQNPLAFAPKINRSSDSALETGDDASKTPASARHKRGCNCKKSNCLKKYCECYQGGVGCSINCRCEGCMNAFGRKDRSSIVDMEAEQEEENETSEKSRTVKTQHNIEGVSLLYRGLKRRCLDFEMPGNNQMLSENKTAMCESSSKCVVPSIGIHINGIAMSSKDHKTYVIHDYLRSGKMQVGLQSSISTLHETLDQIENKTREDANQDVPFEPALQDLNLSIPEKKRKRVKLESFNRCNCKKSKCLKLYCECFGAGVYCIERCSCVDCFNKPIHEDIVLATRKQIESRDPLAFAPRVIRISDSDLETEVNMDDSNKTPASARHKRGCNCRKSNCLQKYCECYQGRVGCSIDCKCEECKNTFGHKDDKRRKTKHLRKA